MSTDDFGHKFCATLLRVNVGEAGLVWTEATRWPVVVVIVVAATHWTVG